MNTQNKKPEQPAASAGETMKDSMAESNKTNDNQRLPAAEDFTDNDGRLDAEAFKESYRKDADDRTDGIRRDNTKQ